MEESWGSADVEERNKNVLRKAQDGRDGAGIKQEKKKEGKKEELRRNKAEIKQEKNRKKTGKKQEKSNFCLLLTAALDEPFPFPDCFSWPLSAVDLIQQNKPWNHL